jgi:hypothetical protein
LPIYLHVPQEQQDQVTHRETEDLLEDGSLVELFSFLSPPYNPLKSDAVWVIFAPDKIIFIFSYFFIDKDLKITYKIIEHKERPKGQGIKPEERQGPPAKEEG